MSAVCTAWEGANTKKGTRSLRCLTYVRLWRMTGLHVMCAGGSAVYVQIVESESGKSAYLSAPHLGLLHVEEEVGEALGAGVSRMCGYAD
jgi:hypothetical protein